MNRWLMIRIICRRPSSHLALETQQPNVNAAVGGARDDNMIPPRKADALRQCFLNRIGTDTTGNFQRALGNAHRCAGRVRRK
jgi:hypothetical protein